MTPSVRLLHRTLSGLAIAAALLPASAAETTSPPVKPDLAKGQAVATAVCVSCHATDGSRGSPANPILQGQHADYLSKQLADFKSGKRKSPIMQGIAQALSADDMRNVSAFYASKQAKPGFAKNKQLVAVGEAIHRGGLPDRQVPACSGCHSPNGVGVPSQYPRVAGQHADYLEAQLVAFRSGARANNAVMTEVAAKMNDREIKATADFLAGLR